MTRTLRIAQAKATNEHLQAILGLVEEARTWLPAKGTNQWSTPWPDREGRDERVWRGLEVGATWVVWDRNEDKDILAATVTIAAKPNLAVWSKSRCNLADQAVYAHRLITARNYAGYGLGAELIDWTGLRGRREYGAEWIRIDVWTSNEALHGYYMKRGFKPCGTCPDRSYPSGKLFQKPMSKVSAPASPLFDEQEQAPDVFATTAVAQPDLCTA
jgi:GNAT superfamily N-acetyltransferase